MYVEHPDIRPVRFKDGREGYVLKQPWSYVWQVERSGTVYDRQLRFPIGFPSDGASVPRIVWSCSGITPDGLVRAAALFHDGAYRWKGLWPHGWLFERTALPDWNGWKEVNVERRSYKRKWADCVFELLMMVAGEDEAQRRIAYRAVRLLGWRAWNRKAEPLEVDYE